LFNHYGPTECSVVTTGTRVEERGDLDRTPPIGRPIDNTRVYVLDPEMSLAPRGIPGELYIGGASVGRGYVNRPELTAATFVPDPFAEEAGARLYRSGDLVRWSSDGQLEFLGRVDDQVKVRGFRVEPSEIEAAMMSFPGVREAVVVAKETEGDQARPKRLIGYVVAEAHAHGSRGRRSAARAGGEVAEDLRRGGLRRGGIARRLADVQHRGLDE
jgi:acyl-coenzyme A synthetase/AMP-(fatty) acid ligase